MPPGDAVLANAPSPQATPTYDASGQATEPSIRVFPDGWNGFKYWLLVNPYPGGDESKENPSILVSNNGADWTVPPGLANPIARPTLGHLDDGELFYDPISDQLWSYYIWEDYSKMTHVLRKISSDGVNWMEAEDVMTVPDYSIESPTFARFLDQYYMWSVNAGSIGCAAATSSVEFRTSLDGVIWSEPQKTDLAQPGYTVWHIEVISVPSRGELWMLSAAYPIGNQCGSTVLFFSTSADGVHWKHFKHIALGTGSSWDHGQIYRSTGAYDFQKGLLRVWYSAETNSIWHVGYTEQKYPEFLHDLDR